MTSQPSAAQATRYVAFYSLFGLNQLKAEVSGHTSLPPHTWVSAALCMFDSNKLLSFSNGHILVKSFCASAFLIMIAEEEWFTFFDGSAFENAGVVF